MPGFAGHFFGCCLAVPPLLSGFNSYRATILLILGVTAASPY
jgi:hypothetical protein